MFCWVSHDGENRVALNLNFSALGILNESHAMPGPVISCYIYVGEKSIEYTCIRHTEPPPQNRQLQIQHAHLSKNKRTYIPCPENQETTIHRQLKSVARWGAWRGGCLYIANKDSLFDISCLVFSAWVSTEYAELWPGPGWAMANVRVRDMTSCWYVRPLRSINPGKWILTGSDNKSRIQLPKKKIETQK